VTWDVPSNASWDVDILGIYPLFLWLSTSALNMHYVPLTKHVCMDWVRSFNMQRDPNIGPPKHSSLWTYVFFR
jgi:hypothetical protein